MKKQQTLELRKKVQHYAQLGYSNSKIARELGVSRPFVIKWKGGKDVTEDHRGWQKGKKRKYTDAQEKIVIKARKNLENKFFLDPRQYCRIYLERISLMTS